MVWYDATKEELRYTLGALVLEGLQGDAFDVAMDMGREAICKSDGVPKLIERMKEFVFPYSIAEAKEL